MEEKKGKQKEVYSYLEVQFFAINNTYCPDFQNNRSSERESHPFLLPMAITLLSSVDIVYI